MNESCRWVRSRLTLGLAVPIAVASLSVPGAVTPASAQELQDTATADTARPFVAGGVYDRPYLGRLLGRTAVGGYAEAHARYERSDGVTEELGFLAKRFNLFTATQVSDFVRIGAELEVEEGGEEIKLEYAAIDIALHPALTVRGGMILSPLGRFNLAHDSPLNPMTDRPILSTDLLGVALSEPGFGLLGSLGVVGSGRVTYEVYATNGFHAGVVEGDESGTRPPAGRANVEDNNASPAFVGRVAWSPAVGHELGVSAHHGAYNVFRLDGETVARRRDLTIAVVDLETAVLGVDLLGEVALVRVDLDPALAGVFASRQRGAYLDAERTLINGLVPAMPRSSLSVKARVDAVDFDADLPGDGLVKISAGFNFRPTADTALKLEYVRGREWDRFNTPTETAAILVSLATYF